MKLLRLLIFITLLPLFTFCQPAHYWQQHINYDIKVTLNDKDQFLDGTIEMEYFNNSPDTLPFIWIHLWPNTYKNDLTAFSDQLLENGNTDFYFSDEDQKGYINRLNFKVNGIVARTEDHPQHQDIIKVILPMDLIPGKSVLLSTPFHIKLPFNFSRGGHIGSSYQVTQWYPKPAVYDRKGWHPMPYLDQGEFYGEFAKYKVQINVPEAYVVAATGTLLKETSQDSLKSLIFVQDSAHDFAWFADKDFIVLQDTLQTGSKTIAIKAYHTSDKTGVWKNSLQFIKQAIITKSEWIGEYPYNSLSVVERPGKNAGGMEYPGITLVSVPENEKDFDLLINHEIGHNWFYGALASNERAHPWMDEGMNSFYDKRYQSLYYGNPDTMIKNHFLRNRFPDEIDLLALNTVLASHKDQPIETTSEDFSLLNYNVIAYTKTALWLQQLESQTGKTKFDLLMHNYYDLWKFKHPYPEDFRQVAESIAGPMEESFSLLHKTGPITNPVKKELRIFPLFSFKNTDKYNYIFLSPALGYNTYDRLMVGAVVHNYTLPPAKFRFFAAPLYATGSKQFNGTARASLNIFTGTNGAKVEISLAGSRFTANTFKDSANNITYLGFSKIVPSLKYGFGNKDPRSTVEKFILWKSYLISERSYLFTNDTNTQQYIITYPVERSYIHQLKFVISNSRKLYPFAAELMGESGKGFIKTTLTADYYFNYSKGGGLNVRFFAGKFYYTNNSQGSAFKTFRYHLNMTGANGYEDYTYSNYFVGRNEFEGFQSQQIMIKDGGFKVRTDLLSNKYGRTDDWLSAANFTSTIPKNIIPIPIKLFADIGTYAEAWKKDAPTGKFVYDAGITISLLKNIVNIYIPLFYSKIYKDYYRSYVNEKRFRKSISFSIDIQQLSLKKLFPDFVIQ